MSYIRENNKFYFQVIDFMMNSAMPDLRAAGKNPYISSTSALRLALTHKVIHRNCAELCGGDKLSPLRHLAVIARDVHDFYA